MMIHWGSLSIAIILNSFAHFMIKNSSLIVEISRKKVIFFLVGASCFGSSLIFYTVALSKIRLTTAFPLSLGFGAILTTFLAAMFLHEKVDLTFFIGLALVIGGACIITMSCTCMGLLKVVHDIPICRITPFSCK